MQAQFNFSQQQYRQYQTCPEVNYQGGHLGGLPGCVYCAEIFRRYRILNGQQVPTSQEKMQSYQENQQVSERQVVNETQKLSVKVGADDDQECGKLVCMKAGFCTCE